MNLKRLEKDFQLLMEEYQSENLVRIENVNSEVTEDKGEKVGEITYLLEFKDHPGSLTVDIFYYNRITGLGNNYDKGYDVTVNTIKEDKNFSYKQYKYASNIKDLINVIEELKRKSV